MHNSTDEGRKLVAAVADRHGVSTDAVHHLLMAIAAGQGSQAVKAKPACLSQKRLADVGQTNCGSTKLTNQLHAILRHLPVLSLDGEADIRYVELRADREQRGTLICGNDTLIAAHALALGAGSSQFARGRGIFGRDRAGILTEIGSRSIARSLPLAVRTGPMPTSPQCNQSECPANCGAITID